MDKDFIKGSLLGGAIGDALGYPVEFYGESQIFAKYGNKGITEYELAGNGKALISDDTQMTIFTAKGILTGDMRGARRGIQGKPQIYVYMAYLDWLTTQTEPYDKSRTSYHLSNEYMLPELFSRRAPGMTCLSALDHYSSSNEKPIENFIGNKLNNSKGCGGIMRVAPLALNYPNRDIKELDEEAAQIAAITHSHPLGYLPAAVLNHIICRIVFHKNDDSIEDIVVDALNTVAEIFSDAQYTEHIEYMNKLVKLAIELSKNNDSDVDNIHQLGEGWVAEETLAIAVYCALKYQNDFSKAVIASVNHNGDSDSTGAVTGNIVGAIVGYDAIESKWKENLEFSDLLLELANSLCFAWK